MATATGVAELDLKVRCLVYRCRRARLIKKFARGCTSVPSRSPRCRQAPLQLIDSQGRLRSMEDDVLTDGILTIDVDGTPTVMLSALNWRKVEDAGHAWFRSDLSFQTS